MKLNNLRPAEGSVKTRKRVGRGAGSGLGGTSTRGHKGTWSVVQDTFCKRIRDHKTEPVCERYGGCRKADVEHPEGVRTDDG